MTHDLAAIPRNGGIEVWNPLYLELKPVTERTVRLCIGWLSLPDDVLRKFPRDKRAETIRDLMLAGF